MWCWIQPDTLRYYQADLVLDLFGDWTLICAWGGLGSARGKQISTGLASHEEGLQRIQKLDAHRQRRGYVPVTSLAHWPAQVMALRGAHPPPAAHRPPSPGHPAPAPQGELLG